MILTLSIILVILIIALWAVIMVFAWREHHGTETKHLKRGDVVAVWNKAARLARRSWYGSQRYGRQLALWSNKRATGALVTLFPKAKSAFSTQDMMTGLEHGPSSYFLANLSKNPTIKKPAVRRKKALSEE